MKKITLILVITILALADSGCESDPITSKDLQGIWGGEGIQLEIETKGGQLQLDCGSGQIEETIVPGGNGQFSVDGWYSFNGGPVPVGGYPRFSARFDGKVTGPTMTLTVTRLDTGQLIGPYYLEYGNSGQLRLCL